MEVVQTDNEPEEEVETDKIEETSQERRAREEAEHLVTHRQEFVQGLHDMADFLAERPELIERYDSFDLNSYFNEKKLNEFKARVKLLGTSKKEVGPYSAYFEVYKKFGPHKISVNMTREAVCTKTVTGTRMVAATEDKTIPGKPEHMEATYSWVCPPSILGLDDPTEEETDVDSPEDVERAVDRATNNFQTDED